MGRISPSRREFIGRLAAGATAMGVLTNESSLAGGQTAAPPTVYIPKVLKQSLLTMNGISARTITEHEKLYKGYVSKANEILGLLKNADRSKANQTYSDLREMKVELTFAVGGIKNHEIYFSNLGGVGGKPSGVLHAQIEKDFGSYSDWESDFKASGLAARGWVWLAFDRDTETLFNYIGDSQNTFPIWNAVPICALDTYEHAYFIDYAVDRKAYIEAFMKNLDWKDVEARFAAIHTSG